MKKRKRNTYYAGKKKFRSAKALDNYLKKSKYKGTIYIKPPNSKRKYEHIR